VVDGQEVVIRDVYTYNQGTVLGVLTTLADEASRDRAALLVDAVNRELTTGDGRVLVTHGGHDGGLFTGILARYLALTAADPAVDPHTAGTARRLFAPPADGFWTARAPAAEGARFPVDATETALAGGRLE